MPTHTRKFIKQIDANEFTAIITFNCEIVSNRNCEFWAQMNIQWHHCLIHGGSGSRQNATRSLTAKQFANDRKAFDRFTQPKQWIDHFLSFLDATMLCSTAPRAHHDSQSVRSYCDAICVRPPYVYAIPKFQEIALTAPQMAGQSNMINRSINISIAAELAWAIVAWQLTLVSNRSFDMKPTQSPIGGR